jgi:shikimate dehydrogenase
VSQHRAAVLGSPIAHSLSPTLHRAAYAWLGLDWSYEAIEVGAAQLATFVAGLGPEWVGLSLTMPLKEAVLPLLAAIEPAALLTRAVNTVLLDAEGHRGFNTDIAGMVAVLSGHGVTAGARAIVLGGGATARSTLAALARVGAGQVTVAVRRRSVAAELVTLGDQLGLPVAAADWAEGGVLLRHAGERADVVVSTVPRGVADELAASLPRLPASAVLVDVLYDPWPTPLAAAWQRSGGTVAGGRELLVGQALEQVALMTGQTVPAQALWAALPR